MPLKTLLANKLVLIANLSATKPEIALARTISHLKGRVESNLAIKPAAFPAKVTRSNLN